MNLLLISEILPDLPVPDFGPAFQKHMESKRSAAHRAASLTAWNLLARGIMRLGRDTLPEVSFLERGKPVFAGSGLYFSLSHSKNLAAALISDGKCAVDLELRREEVRSRLLNRCLNDREIQAGCDFFEVWTKKECLAKLDGCGLGSHPRETDSLDEKYRGLFFCRDIRDAAGQEYALSALCTNGVEPEWIKLKTEELK